MMMINDLNKIEEVANKEAEKFAYEATNNLGELERETCYQMIADLIKTGIRIMREKVESYDDN